jgi:hypothetical protein
VTIGAVEGQLGQVGAAVRTRGLYAVRLAAVFGIYQAERDSVFEAFRRGSDTGNRAGRRRAFSCPPAAVA